MKPAALLLSALATVAVAAPTATTEVDKRAVTFDINAFNNFKGFNQVNLNYLLNINAIQLGLLGNLAQVNNFDILQFQGLFQHQLFDVQGLLQLQALHTFLQIHQLGFFNGFDLSGLQLQHLNLGLINNVGVVDLQQFISPGVLGQVQSVGSQPPTSFLDPNLVSSAPNVDTSNVAVSASGDGSNVVTAAEQDAQEGRSSLD